MDSTYLTRKGQWPKACLGSPLNFHFTSCDRACVCDKRNDFSTEQQPEPNIGHEDPHLSW